MEVAAHLRTGLGEVFTRERLELKLHFEQQHFGGAGGGQGGQVAAW